MADKETKEMKLLGVNITRVLAERNSDFKGKHEISSNIDISSLDKEKLGLIKEEVIKVNFNFKLDYKELGKVEILGNLMMTFDSKTQKEVLEEWKNKKLPNNIRLTILNIILQRASLKALQLEEEIGLPLHIQLPRLKLEEPKS